MADPASLVRLCPVQREDGPDLVRANAGSRALHAPWSAPFTDMAGFEAWFAGLDPERDAAFVARDAHTGEAAGVTSLSQIVRKRFQNACLGYYGAASFARTGRMTTAVRLTVAHAFGELGLHRLEANIQPGNTASVALVRRLGFRLEGFSPRYLHIGGEWRDHQRWALLADEFPTP